MLADVPHIGNYRLMWVCKITQKAALAIIRISRTHCGEPAWTSARGQAQFLHIHYPYGSTFPWLKWPWSPDWKNPYIIRSTHLLQFTCHAKFCQNSQVTVSWLRLSNIEDTWRYAWTPKWSSLSTLEMGWNPRHANCTTVLWHCGVLSSLVLQHSVA